MNIGHGTSMIISASLGTDTEMVSREISLKNLNILIGTNGVGKSLILKLNWVMNMISNLIVYQKTGLEEGAQFILDHSIPESNALGVVGLRYDSGAEVIIHILEGKVVKVEYKGFEKIAQMAKPVFMSSEMRLFSSMKWYLRARKALDVSKPEFILSLVKDFKLYDIMYIEGLINKMPVKCTGQISDMMESISNLDIKEVSFTGDDFELVTESGDKKPLSLLGNGEQSMLNMLLGAC